MSEWSWSEVPVDVYVTMKVFHDETDASPVDGVFRDSAINAVVSVPFMDRCEIRVDGRTFTVDYTVAEVFDRIRKARESAVGEIAKSYGRRTR